MAFFLCPALKLSGLPPSGQAHYVGMPLYPPGFFEPCLRVAWNTISRLRATRSASRDRIVSAEEPILVCGLAVLAASVS